MDPTQPSITNGVNKETVERSSEQFDLNAENNFTWNPVWDLERYGKSSNRNFDGKQFSIECARPESFLYYVQAE